MLTLFIVAHFLVFLTLMIHALARPDLSSTTRIAWIFTLLVLPFVGIVFYFLYATIRFGGREGRGHRAAIKATHQMVLASGEPADIVKHGPASGFATVINGFGVTTGNRESFWPAPMLNAHG